jgi:major membrane immunogen (membrane-anchored lipoprotein)
LNEDSTGGSGDETIPDQADGSYFYHAPRIEFPIKGGMGFKITFKDGKVTKMEANDNFPLSKKGFNVKDPKEYNTKLFKKSIKDGGLVPGKLDGDKIIPADEPQKAAGPKKPFTKYGDELKKNAPKKMVNLLKIGEGTYKVATDSRAGTTTYESQRHKITDAKFKDVELSSPDWAGKSKGSYMLATTWRRRDATAVDLYFYEPKGQLTIDGPQFWNYRIDGYAKLNDGTLVPEDYAKHLNKSNK